MEDRSKEILYDHKIKSWLPIFPGFENSGLTPNTQSVVENYNRDLPRNERLPINRFFFQIGRAHV